MGAPEEYVRKQSRAVREIEDEVWPEHWLSMQLWFAVQTQWRWQSTSTRVHRLGLAYESVLALASRLLVADLQCIRRTMTDLEISLALADLQIMERVVLSREAQ
jgi:hypothetical protein